MDEPADFSRLREALRQVSPESNLVSLKDSHNIACFDLLHADTLSTVQVYRKQHVPKTLYLDLECMETSPPLGRGHGRTALISLFDLADKAGIHTVCVTACDIGRYAFAANYTQCNAQQWPELERKLLTRLRAYADCSRGIEREQRAAQIELAAGIIHTSNGQLGKIVASLRVPTIGDAAQPTLAKLLFLSSDKNDQYNAYWTRTERDLARAARNAAAIEPLLQPQPVRPILAANNINPQRRAG